jgi:hypothetical protein
MEFQLKEIPVMYLETRDLSNQIPTTFNDLESRLDTLQSRKFYGTFNDMDGIYQACVAIQEGDDPTSLGLKVGVIAGGLYARAKVMDWAKNVKKIGEQFEQLAEDYKGRIDNTRPSIEFYRRHNEVICLLPIK